MVEEESTTENTACTEKDGWAVGSLGEPNVRRTLQQAFYTNSYAGFWTVLIAPKVEMVTAVMMGQR